MIHVALEGQSDEGAVEKLLKEFGYRMHPPSIKRGTGSLDALIPAYNRAAVRSPWLVVRDADRDCPVALRQSLIGSEQSPAFSLRIACSMIEAWLMADREKFAEYFSVSRARVPDAPEELEHAKRTMLSLCSRSRSREIREGVVDRSGNRPGPRYVAVLNDYARRSWRPRVASERAPSLERAMFEIVRLQSAGVWPTPKFSSDNARPRTTGTSTNHRHPGRPEPANHALGRSQCGLSTEFHAADDGDGRPLAALARPGLGGDGPMCLPLQDTIQVAQAGAGRPCLGDPDAVMGDRAYSSRAIRAAPRRRSIVTIIPQPRDHQTHLSRAWVTRCATPDLRPVA